MNRLALLIVISWSGLLLSVPLVAEAQTGADKRLLLKTSIKVEATRKAGSGSRTSNRRTTEVSSVRVESFISGRGGVPIAAPTFGRSPQPSHGRWIPGCRPARV